MGVGGWVGRGGGRGIITRKNQDKVTLNGSGALVVPVMRGYLIAQQLGSGYNYQEIQLCYYGHQ